jgi:hypothetical protein
VAAVERDVLGALHEVARQHVKALKQARRPRQREEALAAPGQRSARPRRCWSANRGSSTGPCGPG